MNFKSPASLFGESFWFYFSIPENLAENYHAYSRQPGKDYKWVEVVECESTEYAETLGGGLQFLSEMGAYEGGGCLGWVFLEPAFVVLLGIVVSLTCTGIALFQCII